MKTMTCKQLGGACDKKLHAETFEEMAEKSKNHGIEMAKRGDKDHLEAMEKMKDMSQEDMKEWFEEKKRNLRLFLLTNSAKLVFFTIPLENPL